VALIRPKSLQGINALAYSFSSDFDEKSFIKMEPLSVRHFLTNNQPGRIFVGKDRANPE
jgi:hypothetical protein